MTSVFSCVCPVIDNEFHHNIVKVICGSTRLSPRRSTAILTMLWRNSWSIAGTDAWKTDVNMLTTLQWISLRCNKFRFIRIPKSVKKIYIFLLQFVYVLYIFPCTKYHNNKACASSNLWVLRSYTKFSIAPSRQNLPLAGTWSFQFENKLTCLRRKQNQLHRIMWSCRWLAISRPSLDFHNRSNQPRPQGFSKNNLSSNDYLRNSAYIRINSLPLIFSCHINFFLAAISVKSENIRCVQWISSI